MFTWNRSDLIRQFYSKEDICFISSQDSDDAQMHPAGVHPYNFNFNLPQGLPSSFEGEYGYVRYECYAKIDRPWKFDHSTRVAFTVISHLDLNQEQNALMLMVRKLTWLLQDSIFSSVYHLFVSWKVFFRKVLKEKFNFSSFYNILKLCCLNISSRIYTNKKVWV